MLWVRMGTGVMLSGQTGLIGRAVTQTKKENSSH